MTKVTIGAVNTKRKRPDHGKEIEELREKVRELEETLDAIRSGEVDAIIVTKGEVQQIYTLEGVDHPYQILVENIQEGVLTLSRTGMILYTNTRFAEMVKLFLKELPGTSLLNYICPENCLEVEDAIKDIRRKDFRGRARMWHGSSSLPVLITMTSLSQDEDTTISVVITDRSSDEEQILFQAKMLDAVGDAVVAVDTDQKIIYWNDAATKVYGWKKNEAIGHNLEELTDRDLSKETQATGKHFEKGEIWSGEYTVRHRDGHRFCVFANASPIFDDNKKLIAFILASHDITNRKSIEEAVCKSEQKYKELVENADSIIIKMDTDGRISFFNEYAQSFFGYSPEEILGQDIRMLMPSKESKSDRNMDEMTNTILRNPDDFAQNENENVKKNGKRVWILWRNRAIRDSHGTIIGNLAIGQDITDRKEAEEALKKSEERFRLALRNSPVSVAIQDTNLVFQWSFDKHTIRPDEINGRTDTDIFTPEEAAMLIELKREVIKNGKEAQKQIWLTLNGKRVYYDMYLKPLRNNTGQITGIGIATLDRTLEKLTEIALRDNDKRLREANDLLEAVTDATKVIIAAEDSNFRYTYFNKTYAAIIRRLTGKEIMTGMSMIDLFSGLPEEQRSELDEWSKVLNGKSVNDHITFDDPVKGQIIYNVLHVPLRDAKSEIIGAGEIAFDVTSQVRIEENLRETSQYLTNLINYANAPIIVWDPEFRITLFNHAFEHLTGRRAKEVIGHPVEILLPETYLTLAMDLIQKTSEGERWESVEIPILDKKGGIRTVLWNSAMVFGSDGKTIVATIAQGQDITDRKNMESEYRHRAAEFAKMNVILKGEISHRESAETNLKKTLSLLNASLESTADGIFVVDRKGMITSYNQNFINMWNIPEDMIKTWDNQTIVRYFQSQIKHPDEYLADMKDLLLHLTRESYDVIELNDGRIFERFSKPQKIGKTTVGRVWSFRDITDRRRSEEKLIASLLEKEVLLREIHHRVKNNLQLVTGLLDMTRMRTGDEATISILTDMMLKIQTMAQIHTRLYESKQFGKIGLTGQFRDQIAALSHIYSSKGHEICCEINTKEIFLPVDQALPCALAVNEILSNSYKHAFIGKKEGLIEISAEEENGEISIRVRDNGIGMPTDFDITRANSLGLKLVRTLVQHQLRGSLTINSKRGTETIIEFPMAGTGA